ncbi:MAG: hypothetical protein J6P28_03735 [Treponema sp.]|nr:hypothetical protein [Treponema sp.]
MKGDLFDSDSVGELISELYHLKKVLLDYSDLTRAGDDLPFELRQRYFTAAQALEKAVHALIGVKDYLEFKGGEDDLK